MTTTHKDIINGLDEYVENLISATVAALIRRGTVRSSDRDDWQQDLRIAILASAPQFHPEKSNWHTFASAVVHRSVQRLIRTRHAACRSGVTCQPIEELSPSEVPAYAEESPGAAHIDFDEIISRLNESERLLLMALATMTTVQAVCHLQWSLRKYYRILDMLRLKLRPLIVDKNPRIKRPVPQI
jgi:DNA-directed RNA polymerase specialized sigma24 family protein